MDLTKECNIRQLGPPFTYYYSEETKSNILAKNVIEIDVKSAFPTICKILFGENHTFVQNIFNIQDKLQRNIFISTTLTEQSKIDGQHYLNELNLWSKMLILSYAYSNYEEIHILEYVKDGILIKGEKKNNPSIELDTFIKKYQIEFHEKIKTYYIRFNKTSISSDSKIKVKGQYHDPPEYFKHILDSFLKGNIYDSELLNHIKRAYSSIYFNILLKSKLNDELKYYYEFQEKKYLDNRNRLTSNIFELYPKSYLFEFIYPLLSLLRTDYKNSKM
jgi:hypothetical protein